MSLLIFFQGLYQGGELPPPENGNGDNGDDNNNVTSWGDDMSIGVFWGHGQAYVRILR